MLPIRVQSAEYKPFFPVNGRGSDYIYGIYNRTRADQRQSDQSSNEAGGRQVKMFKYAMKDGEELRSCRGPFPALLQDMPINGNLLQKAWLPNGYTAAPAIIGMGAEGRVARSKTSSHKFSSRGTTEYERMGAEHS